MRRLLSALTAAAIAASSATASQADSAPEGWSQDDYIAYLILSDLLHEMTKETDQLYVTCISNKIGEGSDSEEQRDPSPHLLVALIARFAEDGRNVPIRLASQCHELPGRVEEITTGNSAMWVVAEDNMGKGTQDCGPYLARWHHAGLWGGGTYYRLVPDKTLLRSSAAIAISWNRRESSRPVI